MSKQVYGVYKSSSSISVTKIEESEDYKKYSNVVELESLSDRNGNGSFYMKIFTQGEFKEIISKDWKINPLINCSYNWICVWAKIDTIDVNNKENTLGTTIDSRSIYQRNGDDTEGIRSVFRFIASLKEYLNAEHYLLNKKIENTFEKWKFYLFEDVKLSPEEYSIALNTLLEINHEFEQLQMNCNKADLSMVNNLNEAISNLRDHYDQFMNKKQ